ncbi:MAG: DUF1549 and DUF1553 domain-containing protein [Verrucomicrobiota bacterium]|nr:DUF1549 and DUF1553 domain-containing protein [Verrucomicrobiota bacterium]
MPRVLFGLGRLAWLAVWLVVTCPSTSAADAEKATPIDWDKARKWWAYQAPQKNELPAVSNSAWPSQRIDHFILARLDSEQLTPSPETTKHILARRLYLDLTGLPPTPAEMAAFLSDETGDAYERLVEELMQRRAFGERLASMWLNNVRYAEDQAHQVGANTAFFYPNAYRYREWVIDAFNNDVPYDKFIRKQLAADLIKDTPTGDLPALGFIGLGHKYYNRGRLDVKAEEWAEQVDTLTRSLLGLTVACAQCHDHKYDAFTQKDYYALAGVFASTDLVDRMADGSKIKKDTEAAKKRIDTIHMVHDKKPENLHVFLRGNPETKGEIVPRRFLRVLSEGEPKPFTQGTGRLELAESIVSPDNPLTARVIVNRVWSMFFGRGLVTTPSNFGLLGTKPSHPALLDDLAVRFMENGWSMKRLIREMVLSSTYRQRSDESESNRAIDPGNTHLWRMNRRRLSIEQWRDSILAAGDNLERTGGKSLELTDKKNVRRTVYARVSRKKLNDMLMQFDYPDPNVHAAKRSATTTAMQKLFVMNNRFMVEQAKRLAKRVTGDSPDASAEQVHSIYDILYNRKPSAAELDLALGFLQLPAESRLTRWEQYSHALLAANEMSYID